MKKDLGSGSVFKWMLAMGLPTMVAQIINLLYNMVDKIYIGHIKDVGGDALTGVGLCTSLILIISAFASFVNSGGAPLASIALGKGEKDKALKICGNGLTFLITISIILMVLFYTTMDFYFPLVGGSDKTSPYGKEYLSIYLIGTLFVMISLGLNNFIVAQGKSLIAMLSIVIGAVINLILDPILIFGFNLNVTGAALATVISQGCSALWVLIYLSSKKSSIRLQLKMMIPDFKLMLEVAALGISPFVMSITESLITFALSGQLAKYGGGDEYVGSLTVMQSTMQLMSTPLSGFTQGVTSFMAFNYGAKKNDRLKLSVKYLFVILFTYTFLFTLTTIIWPGMYATMFTENTLIIECTVKYMPIFMLGMLIFGIQRTCQTSFVAMGQAKISLFIALLRKVILLVPLAFILPLEFNVLGVYMSEPIADGLAASICGIIFLIRFPKILKNNV